MVEWLTHNSGAAFNNNGVTQLAEYVWDNSAQAVSMSELVADSDFMTTPVRDTYNAVVLPGATTYFANLPVGSVADFPSSTGWYSMPHAHLSAAQGRPWVAPTTIDYTGFNDLHVTIGRARVLSDRARYHIEKQSGGLVLTRVLREGEIVDLYDFNFETGEPAISAATLQIGYGNGSYTGMTDGLGRNRGKIYFVRIKFNKEHSGLP